MTGLRVRDGSGLSRGNRLTSRSLVRVCSGAWRNIPLAAYYQASMAIAGQRGTLRNYFRGTSLQGRFWGKTGTLTGVRSISGILETDRWPPLREHDLRTGPTHPTVRDGPDSAGEPENQPLPLMERRRDAAR